MGKDLLITFIIVTLAFGWYMEHRSYDYLKKDFRNYTQGIHEILENNQEALEEIKAFEEDLMSEKFAEADARSEYNYHQR